VCRRRELSLGFYRELQEAVAWMLREKFKGNKPKNESTEAKHCGGTACSSVETSVMEVEQRSSVRQVLLSNQLV
jgi:hypothetical protein